ncbi:gamma-glutamyltransferase [Synechococcus sp. Cu2B8-bc1011]|uniref:gamma-glutamyltransferase n=1 Tax=Synechococcus sp. Cu2B8-bc1011 TaxID=3093725 RepID=UPI0039AF150F
MSWQTLPPSLVFLMPMVGRGEQNAVAPRRRPLSLMMPIIVLNQEVNSWLATGSPGGSRIMTTVLQAF